MFSSCLGYPYGNKVVPEQISLDSPNKNTLKRVLNYYKLSNHVFVIMYGVGSGSIDVCKMSTVLGERIIYKVVDYSSNGIIADLKNLKLTANALTEGKTGPSDLFSRERIFRLKTTIKDFLKDGKNVTAIGVSHGSLILHGAILKLQMDMDVNQSMLNHLNVLTVGSPRYLPKDLLLPIKQTSQSSPAPAPIQIEKVLNFYHKRDSYIRKLHILASKPGSSFRVPDLSKVKLKPEMKTEQVTKEFKSVQVTVFDTAKHNESYIYDANNGIVIVCKDNYRNPEEPFTEKSDEYFVPHTFEEDLVMKFIPFFRNACLYHATCYNLYPIMDYPLMFHATNPKIKNNTDYYFKYCEQQQNGGGTNIYIKYMDKRCRVYLENNTKMKYIKKQGNKVYLKDVKGKYRYIKNS